MAVVLGTNAGFVTVSPTVDPAGSATTVATTVQARANVLKDTAPTGSVRITEMGWWCLTANNDANYEVGLYASDGVVVPGEAGTRLQVSATNAKGTIAGWKKVTGLNWMITPGVIYWLGLQNDTSNTNTQSNGESSGGPGLDETVNTTLPNPYGGGAISTPAGILCVYALIEVASGPSNLKSLDTNVKSNIKSYNTNPIANIKSINTNI